MQRRDWQPEGAGPRSSDSARRGHPGVREWLTIPLLLVGTLAFGVGWIFGVVLLWSSPVWKVREKILATALFPGGLPFGLLFGVFGVPVVVGIRAGNQGLSVVQSVCAFALEVAAVIGPLFTAGYLAVRLLREGRPTHDQAPPRGARHAAGAVVLAIVVVVPIAAGLAFLGKSFFGWGTTPPPSTGIVARVVYVKGAVPPPPGSASTPVPDGTWVMLQAQVAGTSTPDAVSGVGSHLRHGATLSLPLRPGVAYNVHAEVGALHCDHGSPVVLTPGRLSSVVVYCSPLVAGPTATLPFPPSSRG
jgi:hypothetical protein